MAFHFYNTKNISRIRLYRQLDNLIKKSGKCIEDYNDSTLQNISDDYAICLYSDVKNLDGFAELANRWELVEWGKYESSYAPGIKKDFIVFTEMKDLIWNPNFGRVDCFDNYFRKYELFAIVPRSKRGEVLSNGIMPTSIYRMRTDDGFEFNDERVYLVSKFLSENLDNGAVKVSDAVEKMIELFRSKYDDCEYDIWKVRIPDYAVFCKDASFRYGGYVKKKIGPDMIELIDIEDLRSLKMDRTPDIDLSFLTKKRRDRGK